MKRLAALFERPLRIGPTEMLVFRVLDVAYVERGAVLRVDDLVVD